MKQHFRKINFWVVLFLDVLLLVGAHLFSYAIRFEGQFLQTYWSNILTVLPFLLGLKITIFSFFGLYRGMWRYTSLIDLLNILKACAVATFLALGSLLLINRFEGYSRSVFAIDALLTFLFISGLRVGLRLYYSYINKNIVDIYTGSLLNRGRKKLLVIGAGDAAEKIVREIHDNRTLPYNVSGFLDDHPTKIGKMIHGIPVHGAIGDLHTVVQKTEPDEILIAIPSAKRDQMSRIVDLCRTSGLPFKTLPSIGEMINQGVSIKTIRDVSYKDLLGRPPVKLKLEQIEEVLSEKTILVTGAGGSIGSELCRQILRFKPGKMILFDASEQNLYQIEMEILHEYGFTDYITVLGKVQDRDLLSHVFSHYKPNIVFHAAAYKHVPMVERNPWEAVFNNIFATRRLMQASMQYKVDRFILVSTDKAVRPTNVMGASKRFAEMIMQAHCGGKTRFMAVRFGNVLGSSGSVIPLFRRQIELGGPVTVTDPEMTRYFMSIEEAAQLILQAASMGRGSEIFILEMGSPVRISQMARDLIRLCGKEPDTEITIKYIGLRPGEKLYEELITEGEGIVSTEHEKIMVLKGNGYDLERFTDPLNKLKFLSKSHDAKGIKAVLHEVVPDYTPKEVESILPGRKSLHKR